MKSTIIILDKEFFEFPKTLKFECCGRKVNKNNLHDIRIEIGLSNSEAFLTCVECEPKNSYSLSLTEFLDDPINWLAHLNDKKWFKPKKFLNSMKKFRGLRREIIGGNKNH